MIVAIVVSIALLLFILYYKYKSNSCSKKEVVKKPISQDANSKIMTEQKKPNESLAYYDKFLMIGTKVFHETYGQGEVVEKIRKQYTIEISVDFPFYFTSEVSIPQVFEIPTAINTGLIRMENVEIDLSDKSKEKGEKEKIKMTEQKIQTNPLRNVHTNAQLLNLIDGGNRKGYQSSVAKYRELIIWMVCIDGKEKGGFKNEYVPGTNENIIIETVVDGKTSFNGEPITHGSLSPDKIVFEKKNVAGIQLFYLKGIYRYIKEKSNPCGSRYYFKVGEAKIKETGGIDIIYY